MSQPTQSANRASNGKPTQSANRASNGKPTQSANPASEGIDARRISLPALGFEVRALVAGSGPPLVLLHGNPDNADEWRPVIELLKNEFRCIAPDFPGYGLSPEPPDSFTYSIESQLRFLDELLRALDVNEKVLLVVHDIGGMLGVPWIARNLDRTHALMVTNTVAFEDFNWFAIARRWGKDSWLGRLRSKAAMRALEIRKGALFKKVFWAQSPQLSEAQIDRVVQTFALNRAAKNTTLRQFRQILKPGFFAGFDEMRRAIGERIPVRVLWGDKDPYVPVQYAQRFPGAAVTVLPEAGHWVPLTATQRLAEEIRALGKP